MSKKVKLTEEQKEIKHLKLFDRFSKVIVLFCLFYGLMLTTLSYYFSYKGYEPLVDLSSVIVNTIVNPVLLWLTQNCICNIFEKNKLAFSTPLTALNQDNNSSDDTSTEDENTSEELNFSENK